MLSSQFTKTKRRSLLRWVDLFTFIAIALLFVNSIKITSKYVWILRVGGMSFACLLVTKTIFDLEDWIDNDGDMIADTYAIATEEVINHEIGYMAAKRIKPYLDPEPVEVEAEIEPDLTPQPQYQLDESKEGDRLAAVILKACHQKEIYPIYQGCQESHSLYRLRFEPQSPDDDKKIAQLPLQRLTKTSQEPLISVEQGCLVIDIPRCDRLFPDYKSLLPQLKPVEPVRLIIGIDTKGQLVTTSVQDFVHLLMGGTTGSGKTTALESILFSFVYPYSPDQVKLWIVDPKGVHVNSRRWGNLPHVEQLLSGDKDPSKVVALLEQLYKISEQRLATLQEYDCVDVYEYNRKYPQSKFPIIFFIFDEINQFIDGKKKELHTGIALMLEKTAAFVRASGISLILITQKPVSSVVPSNVKANLPSGLCLKVTRHHESFLIINESGGQKLAGKGDALFSENGGELVRVQVPSGAIDLLDQVIQKWGTKEVARPRQVQSQPQYAEIDLFPLYNEKITCNSCESDNLAIAELPNNKTEFTCRDCGTKGLLTQKKSTRSF